MRNKPVNSVFVINLLLIKSIKIYQFTLVFMSDTVVDNFVSQIHFILCRWTVGGTTTLEELGEYGSYNLVAKLLV